MKDQDWKQTYPGRRECLRGVRRDVGEFLLVSGCPELVIDTVVQAIHELAANAVVHTPSGWGPDGSFIARVFSYAGDHRGPYVWAEVENDGVTELDLRNVPPRHGLDMVRRMVTKLGIERGERGRVVWFTVDYEPETGEIKQLISHNPPDSATVLA